MNYLALDLGGTKVIVGIYKYNGKIVQIFEKFYHSADWNSLEEIITDFYNSIPKDVEGPTYGCFAVAGHVVNQTSILTNLGWEISRDNLIKITKLKDLEVINDFSVLIYGIPYFLKSQISNVQTGIESNNENNTIAILGAGTGLGVARGIKINNNIISIPSEGGHTEFAPRNLQEWEIAQWLKSDLEIKRVSVERIVSGTGLGDIARWRLSQHDCINHKLKEMSSKFRLNNEIHRDFPKIVSKYAESGDPIMKEVINIWIKAYGSVAGDIAIHELCMGGLWIGGGTAYKQIRNISSNYFIDAMSDKGRFKEFIRKIPVTAITDPKAGLFSAACRAHMLRELKENKLSK